MKKVIIMSIVFVIVFLISLTVEEYKSYNAFQFNQQFFELSINQKLENDYKIESLSKENFGLFLIGDIHREYKITMVNQPQKNEWKPQPRDGFKKGDTLEWEMIIDHTGRWGGGFITIARITKDSPVIFIDAYKP